MNTLASENRRITLAESGNHCPSCGCGREQRTSGGHIRRLTTLVAVIACGLGAYDSFARGGDGARKVLHAIERTSTWFNERLVQEAAVIKHCSDARTAAASAKKELEAARQDVKKLIRSCRAPQAQPQVQPRAVWPFGG